MIPFELGWPGTNEVRTRSVQFYNFRANQFSPCSSVAKIFFAKKDTRMFRCLALLLFLISSVHAAERPRLAVLTDIGGDPDDQQSLVRLLVYSNEFEIEALIASSAGTLNELKEPTTRTDLIKQTIEAYGQVRPNLQKHASGWPEPAQLLKVVRTGSVQRGRDAIGAGKETEASKLLIERIDAGTADRPLNIAIWGGQTDLAQALWR